MPEPRWEERAACRDAEVELFYSAEETDIEAALSYCSECEVRVQCLTQAMVDREHYGVWGGTTELYRRRVFRRNRQSRRHEGPDAA